MKTSKQYSARTGAAKNAISTRPFSLLSFHTYKNYTFLLLHVQYIYTSALSSFSLQFHTTYKNLKEKKREQPSDVANRVHDKLEYFSRLDFIFPAASLPN